MKMNPKLNPWPFCIAGHEHHEHPHLMHKNETSVAGKERAHPGPVPTVGTVGWAPLQALSPRGFTLKVAESLC